MVHDGEFHIDDGLVSDLIAEQMPAWSGLEMRRIETSGTVNVIYRLGTDKLVRLPRLDAFSSGPLREARWLPEFASRLPLQIPEYLALGSPTKAYPSAWSVLSWIQGDNASQANLWNLHRTAEQLGEFVLALREVGTAGAPDGSYRGHGLAGRDADAHRAIEQLPADFDQGALKRVWESCHSAPVWNGDPAWFHSDLHSGNLLARDGDLVAAIDFEGCSVGDPSSDLIAAWWLFDSSSRITFREAINPDEPSWRRGKGWALFMAVAAIPYYGETNPGFTDMARQAIDEILSDK